MASILGAVLYYSIRLNVGNTVLPTAVGIIFIVGVRLLATKYLWSLPKIRLDNKEIQAEIKTIEKVNDNDLEEYK